MEPLNKIYTILWLDIDVSSAGIYFLHSSRYAQVFVAVIAEHVVSLISRNNYVPVIGQLIRMSLQKIVYDDTYMK